MADSKKQPDLHTRGRSRAGKSDLRDVKKLPGVQAFEQGSRLGLVQQHSNLKPGLALSNQELEPDPMPDPIPDPVSDPMWALEAEHWRAGWQRIAGIDEAGRGAWAGPVSVAAVILPKDGLERGYRDSKTLSAAQRERLAERIKLEALAWAIEFAPASEVDEFGVLEATKRASLRAVARLEPAPDALVSDYLRLQTALPLLAPARADANSYSVAAASILAKTARDAVMHSLDLEHHGYGFAQHKGYGVRAHAVALEALGVCAQHRRSFAPVRRLLEV
jgi:ribonuclease HII